MPFFEPHFVASPAWTTVDPGLSETRPSKICSVTRKDSPSETSAGSRYVGSAAPAMMNVTVAFCAPPAVPAAISATAAASGNTNLLTKPLIERAPFVAANPSGGVERSMQP